MYVKDMDCEGNTIQYADRCRVVKIAESGENGWDNDWAQEMDDYVGEIGQVLIINRTSGVLLEFDTDNPDGAVSYWFPAFALRRLPDKFDGVDKVMLFE